MGFLSRADILAAQDVKIEKMSVPEWGGEVGLRTFDGVTRAKLLKPMSDGKNMPGNWSERVLAASACDDKGNLIFGDSDLAELSKKNAVVIERLALKAIELNGLSEDSTERLKGESKPTPK